MGCGVSRPDEDDDVLAVCRERKRLLKSAIERRYSLADAHSRYNDSLSGVAAAVKLFVARHSSPLSPFLITFPSASDADTAQPSNPAFLRQTPSEPTHEAIGCTSPDCVNFSDSSEGESDNEGEGEGEEGRVCEHFYGEAAPPVPLPQEDFGWDFFYPFDRARTEVGLGNGFRPTSEDDDLRRIRQQEGIPEQEEDGGREKGQKRVVAQMNGGEVEAVAAVTAVTAAGEPSPNQEHKGLRLIDTEASGRELLEALKDVDDHFIKAYESGFEVSRLLEVNRVHLLSSLEEIKGLFPFFFASCLLLCITLLQTFSCEFSAHVMIKVGMSGWDQLIQWGLKLQPCKSPSDPKGTRTDEHWEAKPYLEAKPET